MASVRAIRPGHWAFRSAPRVIAGALTLGVLLFLPPDAHASLLSEEMEDKLATFMALFVIFLVPVVLIVLFWMVHILPEKIAHKRHHPQFEAIRTLCLLSLVFGGLLWPLAWLWAYSKPVMYKMAYGTDVHPDALEHDAHRRLDKSRSGGEPSSTGWRGWKSRVPASELTALRADLEALEAKFVRPRAAKWKSCCSASTRSSSG